MKLWMMMDLDELNRSVTSAILRAEALPPSSWEAERAFRDVAEIEEEIAAIVGAHMVEGEVARLGAVTASMSAGDLVRAVQLAERYLADALSAGSHAKLLELRDEAEAEISRAAIGAPNVDPVRFLPIRLTQTTPTGWGAWDRRSWSGR